MFKALSAVLLSCLFGQANAFAQVSVDSCISHIDSSTGKEVYKKFTMQPRVEGGERNLVEDISKKMRYSFELGEIDTIILVSFIVLEEVLYRMERLYGV